MRIPVKLYVVLQNGEAIIEARKLKDIVVSTIFLESKEDLNDLIKQLKKLNRC